MASSSTTEAEDPSQSLKNIKTSVLRVSIHCQGCKRKVQKLLQSVPGVEEIEIDFKQQRVVVTGDVSPETLLRKLVKAGKHAELWPQNPPHEKPQKTTTVSDQESPVSVKQVSPPLPTTTKENPTAQDPKKEPPAATGGKGHEGTGKDSGEAKPEDTAGSAGNQASQPVISETEKKLQEDQQAEKQGGGGAGGGEGKKKKKKKAQNSDRNGSSSSSSGPPPAPSVVSGNASGGPQPTRPPINQNQNQNQSPPQQQRQHGHNGYQYPPPPNYYTPPPAPVYTVSYNTAHPPVNSYTASYYAPPPPQTYAYSSHSHFGSSQMAQQPPDYDSYRQPPAPDSFEMFSDENPNGCLVM